MLLVPQISRWALTHPLSLEEHEKSKNKQMKPDFLDMVPWYSGYISLFVSPYHLPFISVLYLWRVDRYTHVVAFPLLIYIAEHQLIYSRLFLTSWYQ